jgi:hypothetical protein
LAVHQAAPAPDRYTGVPSTVLSSALRTAKAEAAEPSRDEPARGAKLETRLTPGAVLQLQRLAGNTAVSRLLSGSSPACSLRVQRLREDEEDLNYDRTRVPTRKAIGVEAAKPVAVLGGAGGAGLGTGNMYVGSEVVAGAGLIDAGLAVGKGYHRRRQAIAEQDVAGVSVGEAKMRSGGWSAAGSAAGTTQAGLNLGKSAGSTLAGLGVGAAAVGVVGGGLTALQGLWRMYKASGKLSDLSRLSMYTRDGKAWKERVANREKWKLGVAALKVAVGALGIAAGALLIGSNPVGWALGIAAAVAGGVWAISKIAAKIRDFSERRRVKKQLQAERNTGSPARDADMPALEPIDQDVQADAPQKEIPPAREGDSQKRNKARELADEVARQCSTNAKVASHMIGALGRGNIERYINWDAWAMATAKGTDRTPHDRTPRRPEEEDYRAVDSMSLLGVLNISPVEALSPSGQERVEKKLSVAESA